MATVCAKPRCPRIIPSDRYYCDQHSNERLPSLEEYLELQRLYAQETSRTADQIHHVIESHEQREATLREGRRRGGQERARTRSRQAPARRIEIETAWRKKLESDVPEREIAGILARQYGVTPRQIRKYDPRKKGNL